MNPGNALPPAVVTRFTSAARSGLRRFGSARWAIAESAIASGLAWYLAHDVLGHRLPFFAPIAAAVSLSASHVLRGQRSLQLIGGVALGIVIGIIVQAQFGTGPLAIGVAVLTAMYSALLVGGGIFSQGLMFVNQTASSAILVIAFHQPGSGTERLVDAFVGAGVVIVMSVLLFPPDPLRLLSEATQSVFAELRDDMVRLEGHLMRGESLAPDWTLSAGQRVHSELAELAQARAAAIQTATMAPRRRPVREQVRKLTDHTAQLDLLADTVVSMLRGTEEAVLAGKALPRPLRLAISELTAAFIALAQESGPVISSASLAAQRALTRIEEMPEAEATAAEPITSATRTCAQDLLHIIAYWDERRGDERRPRRLIHPTVRQRRGDSFPGTGGG